MKFLLGMALGVAAFGGVSAWMIVLPKELRGAAASAAAAAAIFSAAVQPVHAVDFSGKYSDPKHPNCKREIAMVDSRNVKIAGTDGSPGCPPDGSGKAWRLSGRIVGERSLLVDFTPKGGPADLEGVYDDQASPERIAWPDGNAWTRTESRSGVDLDQDPLM